eukprot:850413-Amphidinium_carterae.1
MLLDELELLARWLRQFTCAYVLGGDFNALPEEVMQTHWPQLVNGVLHHPRLPTCATGRELDYFLVHAELATRAPAASLSTSCCASPHVPVELQLHGLRSSEVIKVPRRKKLFPEDLATELVKKKGLVYA